MHHAESLVGIALRNRVWAAMHRRKKTTLHTIYNTPPRHLFARQVTTVYNNFHHKFSFFRNTIGENPWILEIKYSQN